MARVSEKFSASNRTSITHPDANTFNYAFDQSSRITQVKLGSADILATYSYDQLGRRTSLITDDAGSSANRTVNYAYEPDSALDSLQHLMSGSSNDVNWSYDYNLANQVRVRTMDNGQYLFDAVMKDEDYTSNGLNQYTQIIKGGTTYNLDYDDNGNLVSESEAPGT